MGIIENVNEICFNMANSAKKAGRDPKDVELLAVTKTIPADVISELLAAGVAKVGENRVQELVEKYDVLGNKFEWHLIGRLQSNKIKYILNKVKLVHSLSTLSAAKELERLCEVHGTDMDCLIQVSVTGEESKSGVPKDELGRFIEDISGFSHVKIKGLMTMPMLAEDPEEARPCFAELREIFEGLKSDKRDNFEMKYISMGMSGDYQVAIEEGANIVRVGSAIFK